MLMVREGHQDLHPLLLPHHLHHRSSQTLGSHLGMSTLGGGNHSFLELSSPLQKRRKEMKDFKYFT